MKKSEVRYELGDCSFGPILAACTGYGLCAVFLNRSHEEMVADLRKRFTRFNCLPGDSGLRRVIATIEDPEISYCGELHLEGTVFQKRVWTEIRAVLHAHTVTYGWLAEAVGRPKAVRAVAQACGANPLAVIVPCHRIVGKGHLGSYRWGDEIKKRLLETEKNS